MSGYGFEWSPWGPNRIDLVHPYVDSPANVMRDPEGRISAWVDGEMIGEGYADFNDAMQAAWDHITGDAA